MKKWMTPAAAVALTLALAAGCGNAAKTASGGGDTRSAATDAANSQAGNTAADPGASAKNDAAPKADDPAAADPGTDAPKTGTNAGAGPDAVEPGGAAEGSGAKARPPAQTEAGKPLYRMDKAYNIRPIKEGTPKKVVLLTFDDGPKEKSMLTGMLDTLDKHHAKAIFFVNGYRIKAHPELLSLYKERGQTIGNHSWDHINLKKESAESVAHQIGDVSAIVEKLTGRKPNFFRPPFGAGSDIVRSYVKAHGMLYMTWSDGSLDWDLKATKKNPDLIIKSVLDQVHGGANILMHELPWTAEALDRLLTELEKAGYGFVDPATIDTTAAAQPAK